MGITFLTIEVNMGNNSTEKRNYSLSGKFAASELKETFKNPYSAYFDSIVLDDEDDSGNYRFQDGYAVNSTIEKLKERSS
jgi:hypothetical protein